MVNLGDLLGKKAEVLAQKTIEVGSVYRIKLDRTSGITPKYGDDTRNKFFIILGFDGQGNVYGGVIINSTINANIPPVLKALHLPIKVSKYNFLEYDSFVDCSSLKTTPLSGFLRWKYLGKMDESDVETIIEVLKTSPRIDLGRLTDFGII